MNQSFIYLASASPRRRDLLQQIGVQHRVSPVDIDESPVNDELPADYVRRLARAKAQAASQSLQVCEPILGSDTTVVIDNRILGKPADEAECLDMLSQLSDARHEVLTAVCIIHGDKELSALSRTQVQFRKIAREEILAYWESGEPADKAGGYSIQGRGAIFIRSINGSYSGVMGLPLYETAQMLTECGIDVLTAGALHA